MAKVNAVIPSNFIDSLVGDSNQITGLNNLTPAQVISQYTNLTLNKSVVPTTSRIAPSNCGFVSVTDQSKIANFANVNIPFDVWYYMAKYYLDAINGGTVNAYTVGMLANLLGGNLWYLNAEKRALVIGSGERVAPYVSFAITPNFASTLVGDKFNSTIVNGSNVFSINVPTALNGTSLTIQIKNPDDTNFATATADVANGVVNFTVDAQNPVVGTAYRIQFTGNIFTTANYNFLTRTITATDCFRIQPLVTPYVVGA